MNSEAAVGLIELLAKILGPLSGTGLLGALIYVLWRTGSGHLLRRRLWNFAYGKEPLADETVRAFVEDRNSLMAFRFNAGISSRSLDQARRLATWLKSNDEDITTVRALGHYFDREKVDLIPNLPRKVTALWLLVPVAFGLIVTIAAGTALLSDRAYFILKGDGLWFSASGSDVQSVGPRFFGERARLTIETCQQGSTDSGFSAENATVLCGFLKDPGLKSAIDQAVVAQRSVSVFFVVVSAFMFAQALMKIRQIGLAWDVHRRLQERGAQIPLPF